MRKVKIIEVPCDMGAGLRGASTGIEALRLEAVTQKCSDYTELPTEKLTANNDLMNFADPTPNAHYIEGIAHFYQEIAEKTKETLNKKEFPLIVAGDHSTAGGTIAGVKMQNPEKRVGVIWIDAHADIHTPFTTPSGNVHGMPLATALQIDSEDYAINTPSSEEIKYWETLKNTGSNTPKIKAEDIVYIGVRDTEKEEEKMLKKLNITNITVDAARKMSIQNSAIKALELLKNCDSIYISFDVDSMDPSVSEGTGTPVPNGFTEDEAQLLLTTLIQSQKVVALEVVEINPLLDERNKMAKAVLRILKHIFNWK